MQLESKKFLADALESVLSIQKFTSGCSFDEVAANRQIRSAMYWEFTIIGEALNRLRSIDETTFNRITEASKIVDFRNQIVHGYQVIEDNVTWQIVQDKLPILRRELEQLLKE